MTEIPCLRDRGRSQVSIDFTSFDDPAVAVWRCATGSFEPPVVAACPPVVEYSEELRARAAGELDLLPEGSVIVEMLGDYAVMREQARACWPE